MYWAPRRRMPAVFDPRLRGLGFRAEPPVGVDADTFIQVQSFGVTLNHLPFLNK